MGGECQHFRERIAALAPCQKLHRDELPNLKVKSFEEVKNRCADPLFTVKVATFNSVAREIEPFLVLYQTDKPVLPFLCQDMNKLIKGEIKHIYYVIAVLFICSIQSVVRVSATCN